MSHETSAHPRTPRGQWWLVVALGATTIVLGASGVLQYEHEHGGDGEGHFLGALYHAVQMLILHSPHFEHGANASIEVGRWCGAATAFSAAVALFGRRLRREWRSLRAITWRGHVVVCGLGEKGFEIVMCFAKEHRAKRIVVVDSSPDPVLVEKCEKLGTWVIVGDASRPEVLAQARVTKAKEVIVITASDQTNVRIAAEIRTACVKAGGGPASQVHLSDIHLREALDQWIESAGNSMAGRLHFFDVFDSEARRLLRDHPLDGAGIGRLDPTIAHVVILGFGKMGRSLALRAAKIGHFANGKPLRISVIDRHADRQRERFLFRYPVLGDSRICDLQFHTIEAESLSARALVEKWAAEPATLLHVFICVDDDARGLELALRLQGLLRGCIGCGLRVRIRSQHSLAPILDTARGDAGTIVHFGTVEDTCSDGAFRGDELDDLARAIHERFVEHRIATSQRRPENDPALRKWDEVRDDIRESNRQQADHLRVKLRAIGCELVDVTESADRIETLTQAEIEALAPVEHQRWNAERWLSGWKYGTPGDKDLRISPYLVPWGDLDPSIQKYDLDAVEQIPVLVRDTMKRLKIVRRGESR